MNYDIYFIVSLRQSGLHQFQAVILDECPSVQTVISPLKPRGNFIYRIFYTSTKYKYRITAYLFVSYEYQKEAKIFPYTAIKFRYYHRYGNCLLRSTRWLFIEVRIFSPLKRPFNGSTA